MDKYVGASNAASDIVERFNRHLEKKNRAIGKQRIGDLNKLFAHRYGSRREDYMFPDDDAGLEDLKILLHHYALNNPLAMERIIKLRAPWVADASNLLAQIDAFPMKWRAETLGRHLNLTGVEWKALRLRTIAPVDMTKEERVAHSQALAAQRKKAKRRMSGAQPRAEYESKSLSRTKPWEAEGMSRGTWYRKGRETSVSTIRINMSRPDLSHWDGLRESEEGVGRAKDAPSVRSEDRPSAASLELAGLPAWTDLSKSPEFLSRDEAEWLLGGLKKFARNSVPGHWVTAPNEGATR
jgi:hypothetical protein